MNVGSKKSHTFTELSLARKTVAYYCTVRATSKALSYTVVSSTAIYAGFRDEMNPAPVYLLPCSPTNNSLEVAWDRYDSDFPIVKYYINIFNHSTEFNDTLDCATNIAEAGDPILPDWIEIMSAEMYEFTDMELENGKQYWVVVYGYDYAGHCSINISDPVLIDVTPPFAPNDAMKVGPVTNGVMHITTRDSVTVHWEPWLDFESGVVSYRARLTKMPNCETDDYEQIEIVRDWITILTSDTNQTSLNFAGVQIEPHTPYYIVLLVENCAGHQSYTWSMPIFLDETAPQEGDIKDGEMFDYNEHYTDNTTDLFATLTLVHRPEDIFCETKRMVLFTEDFPEGWEILTDVFWKSKQDNTHIYQKFLQEMTENDENGQKIMMKQNLGELNMQTAAFTSERDDLLEGVYSVTLQAVPGDNILTRYEILSRTWLRGYFVSPIPDNVLNEEDFDPETNDDIEQFSEDAVTEASTGNDTYVPFVFTEPNVTVVNKEEVGYGFGMAILGEEQLSPDGTGSEFYVLLWVIADGILSSNWLPLRFDPTTGFHNYTFTVKPQTLGFVTLWDVDFSVDGVSLIKIDQQDLGGRTYFASISCWANNEHYPTPVDAFTPFESEGWIQDVTFPLPRDQLCHFGEPFYDFESGIVDIHAGITTNDTDLVADILPMEKYQDVCIRCNYRPCDNFNCDDNCTNDNIRDLVQIHFTDLDLSPGRYGTEDDGDLNGIWIPARYYILAKLFNQAGLHSFVKTDGIVIDQTPPEFNLTETACVDPYISMQTPAEEQAANDSLGATWSADDLQSDILEYRVAAAKMNESGDLELLTNYTRLFHTVTEYKISDLSLENGQEYYYVMVAENGAHLTTTVSCSITVR